MTWTRGHIAWTDEIIVQLHELWMQNLTYPQIADILGTTPHSVSNAVIRYLTGCRRRVTQSGEARARPERDVSKVPYLPPSMKNFDFSDNEVLQRQKASQIASIQHCQDILREHGFDKVWEPAR